MNYTKKSYGFSLMELMVVVAIIGIISSIAIPSYNQYVLKSRRSEAHAGLVKMQLQQEAHRMVNISYASAFGSGSTDVHQPTSDYYNFSLSGASATTYTVKATAKSSQTADSACSSLTINQTGTKSPSSCW